jgi:hypothetical protein
LVPEVDVVVAFYGVPSSRLADPAQAKAPVQAHFGELNNFVGFFRCYGMPISLEFVDANYHLLLSILLRIFNFSLLVSLRKIAFGTFYIPSWIHKFATSNSSKNESSLAGSKCGW